MANRLPSPWTICRLFPTTRRNLLVAVGSTLYFYIMFWIIFISFLLFSLLWILMAPLILHVDTIRGKYYLCLPGIVRASVRPGGTLFSIRVWVGFLPFPIDPFKSRKPRVRSVKKKTEGEKKKTEDGKKKKKNGFGLKDLKSGRLMAGAIRIKRFYLNIDTDDFLLNARLIPVFTAINNGRNIRMTANFQGEASLLMDVRTSLGALLLAYIKTKINN